MAEETLVAPDLELGRLVLDQLIRKHFPIKAAAWVYESEGESWRLYLVTPIRNRDLLDTYLRASEAILADAEHKDELKLVSFKIVDAKDPVGRKLIEWAGSAKRDYRRISNSLLEGRLMNAVVYGAAA